MLGKHSSNLGDREILSSFVNLELQSHGTLVVNMCIHVAIIILNPIMLFGKPLNHKMCEEIVHLKVCL
jgi:hypothetical protein